MATISTAGSDDMQNWIVNEMRKPFDLLSQLFRFCFLQTAPNKFSLCLAFHHIIADGASMHSLVTELLMLLTGQPLPPSPLQLTTSCLSPLSPPTSSLGYMAPADQTEESGTKKKRIRQKWMALVGSAKLCTRFERIYTTDDISESVSEWAAIKCAPFLTNAVRDIGKHFGVCPTVVMATMYSLAVQTFLQSQCVVIGCAFANRRRSQQDMVGHTVSLLPMQVDFSKSSGDLASIVAQVNDGWCLILEGGVSLIDLLPVLPCLDTTSTKPHNKSSHDITRGSPLQTVFSFISPPQKVIPKTISIPDGAGIQCRIEYPRSCDAHVDLFLEVRSPGSWDGEGSEVSYLLTWEYRVCSLSRSDVTCLHNLTINFLQSSLRSCRGEAVQGIDIGIDTKALSSRGKLVHSEVVASSYNYTKQLQRLSTKPCSAGGKKMTNYLPGLWVWPSQKEGVNQPNLPTLVRPPQHASIVEGLVLQKSPKLSFIERFMSKAYEVPDQPAFRAGTQTLTYYKTAVMVEKLASVLIKEGVQSGDHVGLVMPHSLMLYISLLATLRCGAGYVPLSLHNPEERIVDMLGLADVNMVVTDVETSHNKLTSYSGRYVCVDSESVRNFLETTDNIPTLPQISYDGQQVAYIIFTSGTTGKPKGVAITNDSLSLFLTNLLLLLTPHDTAVTLAGCTVAWDGHVLDSLGPLLNGSCLVVTATLNIGEGITYAFMSPSAASVVTVPNSMRAIMVGGEAFTRTCYENVKIVPKLLTAYGPTETTVFVSSDHVVGPDVGPYLANLGQAMPNVTLMVCDSDQMPVMLGSEGELCIGGPLVSQVGYYKNHEKTKMAFVKSPLSQYDIVYRTGDWTKMLPDGRIVFLGRTDDQVKLRGMRFQLLEVENTLRKHPQVKMATAIVRNQGSPSAQLVAFATPENVDVNSLFEFAQAHLPSYMVPSAITVLDEMPLKKEGKVDRITLMNLGLPTATDTTDAPDTCDASINDPVTQVTLNLTQTAKQLAGIFGRVLDQKSYAQTADFFTSGGQSLLLFRLLQLVKSELECEVQLADILQNPTPLSLAKIVIASNSRGSATPEGVVSKSVGVVSGDVGVVSESEAEVLNQSLEEEEMMNFTERSLTDTTETSAGNLNDFDYLAPVPDTPLSRGLVQSLCQLQKNTDASEKSTDALSKQLQADSGFYIPSSALVKYHDMNMLQTHLKLKGLLYFFEHANTPIIHLRPPTTATDQPLIFVHGGIIGWPLPYLSLARSVNQSSIVIQRCEDAPTSSFEAMAAYYVSVILAAQPEGPYSLVGVCYGAMLVYEIARQLTDRGHTVQLAVFINHSPAIEKMPQLFNYSGEPLPNTFVDPIVFFRKILALPLTSFEGRMVTGRVVEMGGGDKETGVGVGEGGTWEEAAKRVRLENQVRSVVQEIMSSTDSSWIPFTAGELESVYLGFFHRLRCAWMGYKPRPGADIRQCVLIRDKYHPLFNSFDYGLRALLPDSSRLSVITTPKKMGLLSDTDTFDFVRSTIRMHLQ